MKFINVMEVLNNDTITPNIIHGSVSISEDQKELYLVKDGDILFNRTSETPEEIGLSAVYYGDEDVVFGGFVIRARPISNNIDNEFKKFCFLTFKVRKQIIQRGQGAVRSNIGQSDLETVRISLPTFPEQRAIANYLTTWDNAISKTKKLIEQKQLRKKWLMQNLLTGKKRLEGFDEKIIFLKLKSFIKEVNNRNKEGEISKVLSVTNSRGFIIQSEQFDRVVASKDLSNYKIIRKGQFAYNPSRVNVGSLDLLNNFEEGLLSPMYVIFEVNKDMILSEYLYYQLKTHWFLGHIPQYVQGSVRDSLSFDGLQQMSIFIPSLKEQTSITNILQTADKEIRILQNKLDKLKEQKKGLMQQLLTGKIRVNIQNIQ